MHIDADKQSKNEFGWRLNENAIIIKERLMHPHRAIAMTYFLKHTKLFLQFFSRFRPQRTFQLRWWAQSSILEIPTAPMPIRVTFYVNRTSSIFLFWIFFRREKWFFFRHDDELESTKAILAPLPRIALARHETYEICIALPLSQSNSKKPSIFEFFISLCCSYPLLTFTSSRYFSDWFCNCTASFA